MNLNLASALDHFQVKFTNRGWWNPRLQLWRKSEEEVRVSPSTCNDVRRGYERTLRAVRKTHSFRLHFSSPSMTSQMYFAASLVSLGPCSRRIERPLMVTTGRRRCARRR